ncbi:MAG: VCBS repeat-containing protein [Bacteroidetes bacterium]|nr:VCBS repeat-containing protein [Bacteroidota bacterium]
MMVIIPLINYASEYKVPKKPASVAVADVNLDGYIDIVLGHEVSGIGGLASFLINNGTGEFTLNDTLATGAYETSIQIGHLNNNNEPDIVMLDYDTISQSTSFSIIYDYGSHTFDSIKQFPLYRQITIWDYRVCELSNDTYDDIVFTSHLSKVIGILYNDGNGEFSTPVYYNLDFYPKGLAIGDLNGDSRIDIAICGSKLKIFLNYPSGFDTLNVSNISTYLSHIKIADINNDSKNEIVCSEWGMPGTKKRILIFENDGNNNFQLTYSKWIDEAMAKIFISDLNNDHYNEIIYNVSYSYPNSDYELFHTYILFNNKDGTFQAPVNYYTGVCSHVSYAADLNGDGWKDIVTLNYDFYNPPPDTCTINILFNDGSGKFIIDTSSYKFWQRTGELGGGAVYSFAIKGDKDIFAGTASGVYISTDNGNSWSYKSGALITSAVAVDVTGNIYAGTNGGLYRSTDNGNNWELANTVYYWVSALMVSINGDIIAGCLGQGIYISTDGGNNWEQRNNGLIDFYIFSLSVNNYGDLFAGTSKGIYRSTNNGYNWIEINTGLVDSIIRSITVNKKGDVFCGTEMGLYYSTNNGNNWNKTNLPNNVVTSIVTISNSDIFVGTFNRGVYHSKDNGVSWIQVNSGFLYPSILSIAVNNEGYLLAGAMGSSVYRSVSPPTFVDEINFSIPSKYILYQNYPNPFNPSTTIEYAVPKTGRVMIKIYNMIGEKVAVLVDEERYPGTYTVEWNGEELPSGIYIARLTAGSFAASIKLLLIK